MLDHRTKVNPIRPYLSYKIVNKTDEVAPKSDETKK